MAGLSKDIPAPTRIVVHQTSRLLEIEFADARVFKLPFELLRVYSPSAEVRGHGPGQEVLQTGKRMVGLTSVDPVGNYAIQPHFDDGHSTGLFSWDYLYWLGDEQESLWEDYLARLEQAGESRGPGGTDNDQEPGASSPADKPDAGGAMKATSISRPR
ncbi:MAG: DUF971 domain-containing protein [Burkholderiaceae bacterium]